MRAWRATCLVATLVVSGGVLADQGQALASEPEPVFDEPGFASVVVGKDTVSELGEKLGLSPCQLQSASGELISYLYFVQAEGTAQSYFVRFEVDREDHEGVYAITVAKDPHWSGVCYYPVRSNTPVYGNQGLQLDLTPEEVTERYGTPMKSATLPHVQRFRYVRPMGEQQYEWNLLFRDGRLVEWTVVPLQR